MRSYVLTHRHHDRIACELCSILTVQNKILQTATPDDAGRPRDSTSLRCDFSFEKLGAAGDSDQAFFFVTILFLAYARGELESNRSATIAVSSVRTQFYINKMGSA